MSANEIRSAPAAMTISGFCRYASIGRTKAYELLASKQLVGRKARNRTLIMKEEADRYFASLLEYEPRHPKAA